MRMRSQRPSAFFFSSDAVGQRGRPRGSIAPPSWPRGVSSKVIFGRRLSTGDATANHCDVSAERFSIEQRSRSSPSASWHQGGAGGAPGPHAPPVPCTSFERLAQVLDGRPLPPHSGIYFNQTHYANSATIKGQWVKGSSARLSVWGDDDVGATNHAYQALVAKV